MTTHSLGPSSGGKHCGGGGGCPKVRAKAAGAANIQMGWSLARRARWGGPSEPGPPFCVGVCGKALGALRAAGFPQNGSKTRGLGSRAGSIPARRHRRKLRYPGPDNSQRNGGDVAPGVSGSRGPRGRAREGLGDRPGMTPLPWSPRAPRAAPRPAAQPGPPPAPTPRPPGPAAPPARLSPSPPARPRHSPEFLHVCGRGLRRAKERVSAQQGAPPALSAGSPGCAPTRTPVPQWARRAAAV